MEEEVARRREECPEVHKAEEWPGVQGREVARSTRQKSGQETEQHPLCFLDSCFSTFYVL